MSQEEASNPVTPADLLTRLAEDPDAQIRQAVASNPNTPWSTLEQLAWEFPREFLHNPAGSLQLLAHPEQVSTDAAFWDALLRVASIPSFWWNWLLAHPQLSARPSLRLHIQSVGVTPNFSGSPQEKDKSTLLTLLERLATASAQGASLPTLPDNQLVDQEELLILAQDPYYLVRGAVAANKQTPVTLLRGLAQDQNPWVRRCVAANPLTPAEDLRALATDAAEEVRQEVARNEQTPADILASLAQNPNGSLRLLVAANPQTPAETLRALAQDEYSDGRYEEDQAIIRRAVARNRLAPADVLRTLASDPVAGVRALVAENPRTPVDVLPTLARGYRDIQLALLWNPQTPLELLQSLSQDQDKNVRWLSTLILRLPTEAEQPLHEQAWWEKLRGFFEDSIHHSYWRGVDQLRDAPIEKQLDLLANLAIPISIRQTIIATLSADWNISKLRTAFARSPKWELILAPFVPPLLLPKLATFPHWEIRYLVALHAQTPSETRQLLSQDGNRYVRAVAQRCLIYPL